MRSKISLLFFLYTLASLAQREANIWYFGERAGYMQNWLYSSDHPLN